MFRIFSAFWLTCVLVGCTTENLEYCDERRNCTIPNTVCDFEKKRCVPKPPADQGPDGLPDLGPDLPSTPDQGPAEAGPDGLQPDVKVTKPNGASCKLGDECDSGFCADGVCCGSACDGACVSCKRAGSEGKCTPYDKDTDPETECQGGHSDCAGSCDGSGSCSYAAKMGNSCGAPVCATDQLETGVCESDGTCKRTKASCGGYACADGSSCRKDCSSPSHCTGVFQCLNQVCEADLPLGQACGVNNKACKSGFCVDGVCCSSSSCTACNRCDLAGKEGSCSPEPNGTSCGTDSCTGGSFVVPACQGGACKPGSTSCAPFLCNAGGTACAASCSKSTDCVSGHYCDAGGGCVPKKGNGQACGSKEECSSDICTVEGYCCDRACAGECETCAGKAACTFRAPGTKCGPSDTCKDDPTTSYIETHACDGLSATCQITKTTCDPYVCGSSATCKSSCVGHDDCSSSVCKTWGGAAPFACVSQSQVCYVDSKSTGGSGTQLMPYPELSDCPSGSPAIIAAKNGDYTTGITTQAAVIVGPDAIYSAGTLTHAPRIAGTLQVGASGTLRVIGLYLPKGVKATGASELQLAGSRVSGATGPAIDAPNVGKLILQDVEIENAKGILFSGGTMTVENVRLTNVVGTEAAMSLSNATVTGSDLTISVCPQQGLETTNSQISLDRVVVQGCGSGLVLDTDSSGSLSNVLVSGANLGVVIATNKTLHLQYATIVNNATGIQCDFSSSVLSNSILWNNATNEQGGNCTISYTASGDSLAGPGNLTISDPKFVSTTDFRLQSTSPCIDAAADAVTGAPNPTTDLDGLPRKVNKKNLTNKSDMGAYELQ
jgi:hypothetical protein